MHKNRLPLEKHLKMLHHKEKSPLTPKNSHEDMDWFQLDEYPEILTHGENGIMYNPKRTNEEGIRKPLYQDLPQKQKYPMYPKMNNEEGEMFPWDKYLEMLHNKENIPMYPRMSNEDRERIPLDEHKEMLRRKDNIPRVSNKDGEMSQLDEHEKMLRRKEKNPRVSNEDGGRFPLDEHEEMLRRKENIPIMSNE